MDIKGLNWGGMVSPSRGSIKDISNLPQRNQGDELPISNADVEKAPSLAIPKHEPMQVFKDETREIWDGYNQLASALPKMTTHLQDLMVNVEEQARQVVGDKEWDVSINENNELVIYGDDLTDDERETLGALLQDAGVDQKMIDLRDVVIDSLSVVQRGPEKDWRPDIFDHFEMDKTSFQQVFRLREHIENTDKNANRFSEANNEFQSVRYSMDALFEQVRQRGDLNGEVAKGYVIDTHA